MWSRAAIHRSQTGLRSAEPLVWEARDRRRAQLERDTEIIAGVLERHGIETRRPDDGTVLLGLCTGVMESATAAYRNLVFLPVVAARLRREMADGLEFFLRRHARGRFARYLVFTSGARCDVLDVRARVRALNRAVSRWASEVAADYEVEVLFRAIELTCDDADTFHVHANVVILPVKKLPPEHWNEFLRRTKNFLGAHWSDNGRIRDIREAVKYVVKGDDVRRLAERHPEVLVELYDGLRGVRIVQPLGGFRRWRRRLRDDRQRVAAIEIGGKRRLVLTERQQRDPVREGLGDPLPIPDTIMSVELPSARFSPYREPIVRLMRPSADPLAHAEGDLARLRSEALKSWRRNGAPDPAGVVAPYRVHKSTLTVGRPGRDVHSQRGSHGPPEAAFAVV